MPKNEFSSIEEKYNLIINNISDYIYIVDRNFKVLEINDSAAALWGKKRCTIINKSLDELFPPEISSRYKSTLTGIFKNGEPVFTESKMIVCGREYHIDAHLNPIKNNKGEIIGVIGVSRDYTKQKLFEIQLKESEYKYRSLIETTNTGFLILDNYGNVIDANQEYVRLTGYKKLDDIKGRNVIEWTADYDVERNNQEVIKCLKNGYVKDLRIDYVDEKGIITSVEINAKVIRTDKSLRILSLCRDITDRKELEKKIITSEKLSAIGKLTAGVAHEFNNIMAIIQGNAQIIEHIVKQKKTKEIIDCAGKISYAVDRGKSIVTNMMAFAKPIEPQKDFYSLCDIFDEIISMQKKQLKSENIKIEHKRLCRNKKKGMKIYADKGQIEQVLINILINARQAIKPKGAGTIRTFCFRENGKIIFNIQDDGIGISEDKIKYIFEPFFTTKGAYSKDNFGIKGTGLGLSICHTIIKNHGGNIEVESEEGKGTLFKIILPEEYSELKIKKSGNVIEDPETENKLKLKVLLVDDETDLLKCLKNILELLNCSVDTAVLGSEGIKLATTKKYDLIFLDILIPDISGETIFQKIREFDGKVPIVFISGHIGAELKRLKKLGLYLFIQKPFSISDIKKILNSVYYNKI
ncbi:PAS domain S-box protein [Candidatus Dependentiae bacterium]|nr:PAS domain S-box protein [Candidatus Dependentiae bacterium]